MKKLYETDYWFENCPMLNPTIKKFFESNNKFLFAYCNADGEYLGQFFNEEPSEDIFIISEERGDSCGAIFERDFTKKVDINNIDSLENALILIDEYTYN